MAQADWYADPSGAHEHRYWDGTAWTDDVADGGVRGTDPLPSPTPAARAGGRSASDTIDGVAATLTAAIESAGLGEHPRLELSTAVSVASGTLTMLVVNPRSAEGFGVGFPDDAAGERLLRAAELHRPGTDLDSEAVVSCLRVLAFHVLLVLPGDTACRTACARALDEPDTHADVAAGLGEAFFAVLDPPSEERALMHEQYRTTPGRDWDHDYHRLVQQHLVDQLAPEVGETSDDAVQLLWGALNAVFETYAIALYPELAKS